MTDEESFIVLEETPSMLQFSLLDSLTSNTSNKDDSIENSAQNETETTSIVKMDKQHSPLCNVSKKKDERMNSAIIDSDPPNIVSDPLKATLAQSFLLGDINCDKMKVPYSVHAYLLLRER